MNKLEIVVAILVALGLVGLILLASLGKALDPILQIVIILVSFLVGTKEPAVVAKIAEKIAARKQTL